MKFITNLFCIALIAVSFATLTSCSNDAYEVNIKDTDIHTIRLKMDVDMGAYSGSADTRATKSWANGSILFIYSSNIKGTAQYNDGFWTLNYSGTLTNEAACQLYYFDCATGVNTTEATLNSSSIVYADANAKMRNLGDEVVLSGTLKPKSTRLRFKGTVGSEVSVKGLRTYSRYTLSTNTLQEVNGEETKLIVGSEGYTPYIYVAYNGSNQEATLTAHYCIFKRTLTSTELASGNSGYFEVPTKNTTQGWTFVGNAPAPKWDGSKANAFARGNGTITSPYEIETGAQLLLMEGKSGYFELKNDIDLDNRNWLPLTFSGTFDGNGCTIKNLAIKRTSDYIGLFAKLSGNNSTIKNLTIEGVNIDCPESDYVGAVMGSSSGGHLENVNVVFTDGSKILGKNYVGGIVGYFSNDVRRGCTVSSTTSNNSGIGGQIRVGGIAGAGGTDTKITDCHVGVNILGESACGGIVGDCGNSTSISCDYCSYEGDITAGNNFSGGIIGYSYPSRQITACKVSGNISGATFGGGLVSVKACYFSGTAATYNTNSYSSYVCLKHSDGSISTYVFDDKNNKSQNVEDITTFLKETYSAYADYWNYNKTWTFEGKMNGKNVKISCPRLNWE